MRIAIDAKSAVMGGARTYLMNFLPPLRDGLGAVGHELVVWRSAVAWADQPWPEGIEYREYHGPGTGPVGGRIGATIGRVWLDQVTLPRDLRKERAAVLFSTANFGPLRCPCRQVLLVRNSAYFDSAFLDRMLSPKVRAYYRMQRWLTLRCIGAADVVLFPTQAMLEMVARWTGGPGSGWSVAHYGVRHDLFQPAPEPRRDEDRPLRLLNVSHYCDQKNLGVLMQALERLDLAERGRFHLTLTAGFGQKGMDQNPFYPNYSQERSLYHRLHASGVVDDIDWKAYGTLPALYQSSDIFVFSSYTESFGHPLVEAMATGLPIVAADVAVNRELCGPAAVYFAPFDVEDCEAAIRRVANDDVLRAKLRAEGLVRAPSFGWERHTAHLAGALMGA